MPSLGRPFADIPFDRSPPFPLRHLRRFPADVAFCGTGQGFPGELVISRSDAFVVYLRLQPPDPKMMKVFDNESAWHRPCFMVGH